MRLVAVTFVVALLSGGCAMQTVDQPTDDSVRPDDIAAEPGNAESTGAGRSAGTQPGAEQQEGVVLPAATATATAEPAGMAPGWENSGNLLPEDTKPSSQSGCANNPACADPLPQPWQQGGGSDVAHMPGGYIPGGNGN